MQRIYFTLPAAALALLPGVAQAQALGDRIDSIFAASTGWFVNLIFASVWGCRGSWAGW